MTQRKMTKEQTIINKILHREQSDKVPTKNTGAPEV